MAAGIYVLVTALVGMLLTRFPGEWFAATQVSTSLLLVFVTWWYVTLTGQMVAVQEKAPRHQLQRQGAAQVIKISLKASMETAGVFGQFPIDTTKAKPDIDWIKAVNELIDFDVALLEQAGLLQPTALGAPTRDVAALVLLAARRFAAIAQAISIEDETSKKGNRPWSWDEVKRNFNADVRPGMTESSRCEWEELIAGKYIERLAKDMAGLEAQAAIVAIGEL